MTFARRNELALVRWVDSTDALFYSTIHIFKSDFVGVPYK